MALLHIKATEEEALSLFEELGPSRVRDLLSQGNKFSLRHSTIAEQWLHQQDQEAAARLTESTKRAEDLAARQADAAERAAAAAERASAAADAASVAAAAQASAAASQAEEARRANRMAHRNMMIGIALTIANIILIAIPFLTKN